MRSSRGIISLMTVTHMQHAALMQACRHGLMYGRMFASTCRPCRHRSSNVLSTAAHACVCTKHSEQKLHHKHSLLDTLAVIRTSNSIQKGPNNGQQNGQRTWNRLPTNGPPITRNVAGCLQAPAKDPLVCCSTRH